MNNCLAIIPARGGSKRILRKNIKDFIKNPVIKYSIDAAKSTQLFDEIMVSTDDIEIKDISINLGANVPFIRSKKNSDDFSTTSDVILEVLNDYYQIGKEFEYICCIYPAAPLINFEKILQAYKKIKENKLTSVFPVVSYRTPIERALKFEGDNIKIKNKKYLNKRSQDLDEYYYDAGQFYWLNTKLFLKERKIFSKNSGAIILSELEAQDIDNEIDWNLAEIKYSLLKNKL